MHRKLKPATLSRVEGKGKIRKPGQGFDLTDEELLATPIKLLTSQQRRRRRVLKSRKRANKANAAAKNRPVRKDTSCAGYNKHGEPCGAYSVTGAKHCMTHLNEAEQAKLGLKRLNELGSQARIEQARGRENINMVASMREVMEVAQDKLINRYFQAMGFEFQGWDENGHAVVVEHGADKGVCLHGVSKEGFIEMSQYPDLMAQIQVLEKINDRVFGKPRQTTVLEGGQRPVQIQPVRDAERARRVAGFLHSIGGIPSDHEGRRRSQPSEESPTNSNDGVGSVVPLHPDEK